MRLLGIDLETTGLDIALDHIVRIGLIIVEAGSDIPLKEWDMSLWDSSYPAVMPAEAFAVNHISMNDCKEFGMKPEAAFMAISEIVKRHKIEFFVGHNAARFDLPFLLKKASLFSLEKVFQETPWIDTHTDVPYPERCQTRKLVHLAVDHRIFNPLAHNALSDVHTMLSILAKYPIREVILRSRSPSVVIQAHVDFENREKAKRRRYSWETCDGKTYPKSWVKSMKACDVDKEIQDADFRVSVLG